ncbi:MAG: hypothetical protein E6K54_07955 [Gammaproteobacteria bacterium]|nr:MAG: hypothetical protein E6K54_07955 [Gammaproteobacteria bacterium]
MDIVLDSDCYESSTYDVHLHLEGYTNDRVVKCMYLDKSPLDFYARIKDDSVLSTQIEVLKMAWPEMTKEKFLQHVCSSSLERGVWINRLNLKKDHTLGLKLSSIKKGDIEQVLRRSTLRKFDGVEQIKSYLDGLKYPNFFIDWMYLILQKCNPNKIGLKKNVLYCLGRAPKIVKIK